MRALLDDLVREGMLRASGQGPARRYGLTAKGRGRARALERVGATTSEIGVTEAAELLDLIYADADSTAYLGPEGEAIAGLACADGHGRRRARRRGTRAA